MKTRKRYLWGRLEPTKESLEDFLSALDGVTQDIYDDLRNLGGDLSGTIDNATVETVGGKTKDEVADAVNKRHTQNTDHIIKDADGDTSVDTETSADEDKIRFKTGGVERVIMTGGKIGIGTTSPAGYIHTYPGELRGLIIDAGDDSSSKQAVLELITLGNGSARLGETGVKGWHITGRGAAFSTTVEQNDFLIVFWDGSEWFKRLFIEHDTGDIYIHSDSYSKNTNGYTKLFNGLILQWGQVTNDGTGDVDVTFPIAFPNEVFAITISDNESGSSKHTTYINNLSTSGFTVAWRTSEGGKNTDTGITTKWIAIGY